MWSPKSYIVNNIRKNVTRLYHQYKPKDKKFITPDASVSEQYAVKDVLLYRYENPRSIMLYNAVAGSL